MKTRPAPAQHNRGAQHSNGSSSRDSDGIAGPDLAQLEHVHHDGQRLDQCRSFVVDVYGDGRAVTGWKGRVLKKRSVRLRPTHEDTAEGVVVLTFEAGFTMTAGDGGLHGDAVADSEILNAGANGNHFACRFMPEDLRINGGSFADAAILIPVQVAATNSDGAYADGEFAVPGIARLGDLALFESARGKRLDGSHEE
jgi:hypothetical protein